jgi:hypothetical protein
VVEPGVLMTDTVEICPCRILGEDEMQLHFPVLRLSVGGITVAGIVDCKQSPEGQRRLVGVPIPLAAFDNEAVTIVLGPLDPPPEASSSTAGCSVR